MNPFGLRLSTSGNQKFMKMCHYLISNGIIISFTTTDLFLFAFFLILPQLAKTTAANNKIAFPIRIIIAGKQEMHLRFAMLLQQLLNLDLWKVKIDIN